LPLIRHQVTFELDEVDEASESWLNTS